MRIHAKSTFLHSNASYENLGQRAFSSRGLQLQIENLHLPHRERRRGERERGESGILRHKNVHFGEDKMYEGAKRGRKKGPLAPTGWVRLRERT